VIIPPRVIPEARKHRLERQYASSQPLDTPQPNKKHHTVDFHPKSVWDAVVLKHQQAMEHRGLPTHEVSDENLDDTYVDFIMFCNPTVPLDTDTTELRKTFRAPPRSDGKAFSTFKLFELIRKLEQKEIKTWAQLAIDLGVEPPALDKGQSAQKVQQYAVRLKRWMHAMHVDAFFEYLLSKAHVYWTQVPSAGDPGSDFGRDGVPAEEDLALRALLPETKPKRGRRKAEDRDNDEDTGRSPAQRPRLDSPTLSDEFISARSLIPESATPASSHPGFSHAFNDRMVPWSATELRGSVPGNFRWNGPDSAQTPLSAYPQSAITPNNRSQLWNDSSEPPSAITPIRGRSRRRHGPAVSSAWPSSGGTSSGKLRGRPPSNRSVTDGPFSTFPANPGAKDVPTINLRDDTPIATPIVSNQQVNHFFPPAMSSSQPTPPVLNSRPSRLQLQVPPRQGGTVRLATPPPPPPPVLLVNGENDSNMHSETLSSSHITPLMEYFGSPADQDPSFQHFVSIAFRQNEDADRTNMDALESHFICEILAADWYDALRMTRLEQGSIAHYECHWKMRFGSIEGEFTIRATVHHGLESVALDGFETSEESWKKRYLDLRQQIRERNATVGNLKSSILDALVVATQNAR
ncbi:ARS-binding protein, partial [Lachnellula willkommii]